MTVSKVFVDRAEESLASVDAPKVFPTSSTPSGSSAAGRKPCPTMRFPLIFLAAASLWAAAPDTGIHIPFEKYKLTNGMRVVLARDTAVPMVAVYMIYDVGSRTEEKGRLGFAHLFEHMMFEGSTLVKKGEYLKYVAASGGELNSSTHLDYTDFFETLPSNHLGLALWLESDRMRSLSITEESLRNQQEAVPQERRRIFESEPYRSAISDQWPAFIFGDFHNTHSVMAASDDLKTATVADVTQFFRTYYAPNNAVLVIAGDFESAEAKKMVAGYFGNIAAQPLPRRPDLKEAARTEGKVTTIKDANARVPAVIIGWPAPARHSPDWYGLSIMDAVLTSGYTARVKLTMAEGRQSLLQGDSNLGWPAASQLDFKDPAYYTAFLIHKPNYSGTDMVDQYQAEIDRIANDGVGRTELERVKAGLRFSKATDAQSTLARAKLLGIYELLDGDAGFADKDYANLLNVTSEQVQAAAKKWLTAARRDVMIIQQASGAAR
jgi:zinc protease